MNLLYFETPSGEPFLAAQSAPEPAAVETGQEDETLWRQVRARVQDSYRKLKDRFDHAERVCSAIRHAGELTVIHPGRLDRERVQKKLLDFFKLRYSKHGRWLVVDSLLAGAGSVLTPLPGPNVFFFYPAVRALSHYFARSGAARGLKLKLSFSSDPLLDAVESHLGHLEAVEEPIRELERRYGLDGLMEQIKTLKGS